MRGNHERWRRHSLFTQLRWVSIPQRAPLLNCSTVAYARAATRTPEHSNIRRGAGPGGCPTGVTEHDGRGCAPPHHDGRRGCLADDGRGCAPGDFTLDASPLTELGCPVSAASAASAPAAAGRPAPTGRPSTAGGVAAPAGVVTPVVSASGTRRAGVARPPAAASPGGVRPPPARRAVPLRTAPAHCPHDDRHEHDHDRRHDEAGHGVTAFPVEPKQPPVGASVSCVHEGCPAVSPAKAELRNF